MQADHDLPKEPTVFNSPLICFAVTLLLFVALLSRQHDLAILAILILFLMGGAKIWSLLSLPRIACITQVNRQRLFPGETLSLVTTVENAKFLPVWVQVCWPRSRTLGVWDDEKASQEESGLLWYQRAVFEQDLVARKRGCYQVGPSHIRTSDGFGFFNAEKQLHDAREIIVYPRIVAVRPMTLPKRDLFGTPGSQSPVKDPVYIIGTRDYQPARPSRYIHWKASARHRRLQEKLFEPSEQGRIMMVLDVRSFEKHGAEDAFENTLEVVASLCLKLEQQDLAVGILSDGAVQGRHVSAAHPARGAQQLADILEVLGRLQMRSNMNWASLMQEISGLRQGISWVYCCYESSRESQQMRALCHKNNATLTLLAWRPNPKIEDGTHPGMTDICHIRDVLPANEAAQ